MLEKKEKVLVKKAAAEVEKAKEYTRTKNKRGMLQNAWMPMDNFFLRYPLPFVPHLSHISVLLCACGDL